jgi:hypothetical protein
MCNTVERVILAAAILVGTTGRAAAGFIVDFDDVTAPDTFADVTPGGSGGPIYTQSGVTFDGGVVLDATHFDPNATSGRNIYITNNTVKLADGSTLSGYIRADFSASLGVTGVTLDITNERYANVTYMLAAFGAAGELIDSRMIDLTPLPTGGYPNATVGTVSVSGYGITSFQVTLSPFEYSGQPTSFAIDTVRLSTDIPPRLSIPEPSSLTLCAAASLAGLGIWARRRPTA